MNMINQPQIRQAYTATGCKPVLSLKNVTLRYRTDASIVTAAYDVSFGVVKVKELHIRQGKRSAGSANRDLLPEIRRLGPRARTARRP